MACPVTSDDVFALRPSDLPEEAILTPFLKSARALMQSVVDCAQAKGQPLSADQIHAIESNLAAHFSTATYPVYSSEKSENASATLAIEVGKGLDSSLFGQNAKALDTSGCLEEIAGAETVNVEIFWGGKPVNAQIPYWDRN